MDLKNGLPSGGPDAYFLRVPKSQWDRIVAECAEPERAAHYAKQLAPALAPGYFDGISPEQGRVLAALFSGSRALSELLLTHPEWISVVEAEPLKKPRLRQGLRREAGVFLLAAMESGDYAGALLKLRAFKQKEMLRIGARDLARLASVPEVTEEISNVADLCIDTVCRISLQQLTQRYGTPYAQDPTTEKWLPAAFCVLGMGKLGGQELNYSSDIDVLFVYSGEGSAFKTTPGKSAKSGRGMPNHQFYARLAESIISECTRMTSEGFLFRIDLRLRPEGKTAPLARSISSYENYYAQYGQSWERMMLIKARCVAGDEGLGAEFLEMVQPFRYPRAISEQIPREVAEMKRRIETEVIRAGELERNVKLGRGGIREIEFLVQTQQVLRAGRMPFLQGTKTLPLLDKLKDYNLMDGGEAQALKEAYCFLRDIEHRLQMEDNRQTHTIPTSRDARTRLAKLMGFKTLGEFEKQLQARNDQVRTVYDRFVKSGDESDSKLPADVHERAEEWKKILEQHSFRDPEHGTRLVKEFVQGPGFGHRSARTIEHALQLLSRFLELCPKRDSGAPKEPFLSDPDRVLARLDSFVARYGAHAMLYDAWVSNPSLFRLLLVAFDRSEFLAELAIRVPDLIDEIEQSGQLRRRKSIEQILADLRHGLRDEDQQAWLRKYFQAEEMRIGLRDILDLADPAQTQEEITALADAYLAYSLEVLMKRHKLRKPPFAIIGLGKLGGRELIYASDLDIIFVADDKADLPPLQKLAVEVIDLLSKRTADGTTFDLDARLRPDGEKGLLVNRLRGYAEYYQKRAMLWEIQSLSRFRPITGQAVVSQRFKELALKLTNFAHPSKDLTTFAPDWKEQIHKMRMRIEKERTPAGRDDLAIKTGRGGLMDVEFVAQAAALANGWHEPNTLAAIQRAGDSGVIGAKAARVLCDNYRKLMQIERILRRWSFEAESVLPDDPAPYYRVSVRCGFNRVEDFRSTVKAWREAIRAEYLKFFNLPGAGELKGD